VYRSSPPNGATFYNQVRWTLLHDLDTDTLVQNIKEQTGKFPHSHVDKDHQSGTEPLDISYTFSHPDGCGIDVALKAGQTREICLQATHQQNSSRWLQFYHAHQLFSPKKIVAMLNDKLSPRHIWQIIDEASMP
jgi:hypothetical protein